MAGTGTVTVKILGDASGFKKALGEVDGSVSHIGSTAAKVAGLAAGAVAAAGIGSLLKDSIAEGRESLEVGRLSDAVIKSTGGAAHVTAQQMGDLANAISAKTGVDDEAIQSGENLLATFTNVRNEVGKGNDVFTQATKVASDMSAALGQDLKSSNIQLGKALNDPIKGITALSRVGVSFTAQQKEQIATLVKSGNTLGAQKVILKELGTEFGGAAEAAADPMQKLGVTVKNLEERVGLALLPVINKAADWLGAVLPGALDAAGTAFNRVKPLIDLIVEGVKALVFSFKTQDLDSGGFIGFMERVGIVLHNKVLPVVQEVAEWVGEHLKPVLIGLAVVVGLLLSPFALAVAAIVLAYIKFQAFRDVVKAVADSLGDFVAAVQERMGAIREAITHVIDVIKIAWKLWGDDLMSIAKVVFDQIKLIVQTAVRIIRDVIDIVLDLINGDWGKAWNALKDLVGAVFSYIAGTIKNELKIVGDVVKAGVEGVVAFFGAIGPGIGRLLGGLADLITVPFRLAFDAIARLWNNTIGKLHFKIPSWVPGIIGGKGFDVPDIPILDSGGIVSSPTLALLAANGRPEAVVPLDKARGGAKTEVNVYLSGVVGDDRAVVEKIRQGLIDIFRSTGDLGFT